MLFEGEKDTITIVEFPPGIGKTWLAVKNALRQVVEHRRIVIIALPNHQSLLNTFAYAVRFFEEYRKKLPETKLPAIIYYEGVERYCPLLREDVFKEAVKTLLAEGLISRKEYEELTRLSPRDYARIYGMNTICRKICPIYRRKLDFPREKIFISTTVKEMYTLKNLFLTKREQGRISRLLDALAKLKEKKLVAELSPEYDSRKKEFNGYCIRSILQKPVYKRRQIVFTGALILVPIQALEYVISIIERKISLLKERGINIPRPLVIVDEYDYYIHRYDTIQLFSIEEVREEKKFAEKIIREEIEKNLRDEDFDEQLFMASLLAYKILSIIEKTYEEAEKGVIEKVFSIASLIFEVAKKPVVVEDRIYPPFSPRKIVLDTVIREFSLLKQYLATAEERLERKHGKQFITANIEFVSIKKLLQLFEQKLFEEKEKMKQPVLVHHFATVYRQDFMEVKRYSIARLVYDFVKRNKRELVVHYRMTAVEEKLAVSLSIVDTRLWFLGQIHADVVLLSATGLPWLSNFYVTRALGIGRMVFEKKYASEDKLSEVFATMSTENIYEEKGFTYIEKKSMLLPKKLKIVMLDKATRLSYVSNGVVVTEKLSFLPPKTSNENIMDVVKVLNEYLMVFRRELARVKQKKIEDYRKGIFVLTQRKDVALLFTTMLYKTLKYCRTYICNGDSCRSFTPRIDILKKKVEHTHYKIEVDDVDIIITWLRGKFTRGIDLPEEMIALTVLVVGTPYKPPQSFDILPAKKQLLDAIMSATQISINIYVEKPDPATLITITHMPLDIVESIAELIQAIGRALRRMWRLRSVVNEKVKIIVSKYTYNKIYMHSPLWFRDIFIQQAMLTFLNR